MYRTLIQTTAEEKNKVFYKILEFKYLVVVGDVFAESEEGTQVRTRGRPCLPSMHFNYSVTPY